MRRVLVYGTLKRGYGNHSVLGDSKFIGNAVTVDSTYSLYDLGYYPGLKMSGDNKITGEVYEVDNPEIAQNLDYLEGYPSLYTKADVEVEVDGQVFEATTYVYNHPVDTAEKLENGIWPKSS
jgi:gamma-glutamylcyclotransferase (GGCT)/AIG2-like uncharacterized protein YtfP